MSSTSERIVIVAYRPHNGKENELLKVSKTHWDRLYAEGLVSDRKPILMKNDAGFVIEVFGWKSKEAIESAHGNTNVQQMWQEYAEVADYIPACEIEEIMSLFSEFSPVM